MNWYITVLKKYAVFSGRAQRQEFWTFIFISLLINVGLSIIDGWINPDPWNLGIISTIYSLLVLIPTLAVTARRFHDTGRSGLWVLLPVLATIAAIIGIILTITTAVSLASTATPTATPTHIIIVVLMLGSALVGIAMIIFLFQDSQEGENPYGPNPKEEVAQEESPPDNTD